MSIPLVIIYKSVYLKGPCDLWYERVGKYSRDTSGYPIVNMNRAQLLAIENVNIVQDFGLQFSKSGSIHT